MKMSKMLGNRFKETPADCQLTSHKLMVRGGYMKQMTTGIYSLYMPTKRITKKIEAIIRDEMDKIDGQEVMFPVVMPASVWQESGRYESIGSEMARFKDRSGQPMVLGMTHEEAAVHLARGTAQSYANYPFMIYQIQTKFRDEPRARGGLIRVREFTMKDAYSFHTSQEDLEQYYARCHQAYQNIFRRCGIPEVVSVKSDSGMMGGNVSHEFMLLTDSGEDTIVLCDCGYRSNMEAADCIVETPEVSEAPLTKVHTPGTKTIEAVCEFLNAPANTSCKAVVYQKNLTDEYVVAFIRGDLEVNETKLRNFLKEEIHPAEITEESGITAGFIGPVGLPKGVSYVVDKSLAELNASVCGANEVDYHYSGYNVKRDTPDAVIGDFAKTYEGAICPVCGKPHIRISRGIEVGNIFQLGTKYTEAMDMTYIGQDGKPHYPIMGCYGIGVGRLAASVCEEKNDEYGPIWPISIAPWQVHICAIKSTDPQVREVADGLYQQLQDAGVEVMYDDRKVSAGNMFSDADLLGVPVRVIVSPKTIKRGAVEVSTRDKSLREDVVPENAVEYVTKLVNDLLAQCK